jgi:hypothetical protein
VIFAQCVCARYPVCSKELKNWIELIQLPPHELFPLMVLYPLLCVVAAYQHRGDGHHRHFQARIHTLVNGTNKDVFGKCSVIFLEEVPNPLKELPTKNFVLFRCPKLVLLEFL